MATITTQPQAIPAPVFQKEHKEATQTNSSFSEFVKKLLPCFEDEETKEQPKEETQEEPKEIEQLYSPVTELATEYGHGYTSSVTWRTSRYFGFATEIQDSEESSDFTDTETIVSDLTEVETYEWTETKITDSAIEEVCQTEEDLGVGQVSHYYYFQNLLRLMTLLQTTQFAELPPINNLNTPILFRIDLKVLPSMKQTLTHINNAFRNCPNFKDFDAADELLTQVESCSTSLAQAPDSYYLMTSCQKLSKDAKFIKKPRQSQQAYNRRVDKTIGEFTTLHEELSQQAATTNQKFITFAKQFTNAREEYTKAMKTAANIYKVLRSDMPTIAGKEIRNLQDFEGYLDEELQGLRMEAENDIKRIGSEMAPVKKNRNLICKAYQQFYSAHCAKFQIDQSELDAIFNKQLYDQASIVQDTYTKEFLGVTYNNYLATLEGAQKALKEVSLLIGALAFSRGVY